MASTKVVTVFGATGKYQAHPAPFLAHHGGGLRCFNAIIAVQYEMETYNLHFLLQATKAALFLDRF